MKYFIIAGEASGDLHGSNLIAEILLQDAHANIQCWGGDMMAQKGALLQKHIKELAFMGFVEVAKNIRTILQNFKLCKQQITAFAPDVIVLIDYPGFNIRMAKWAKLQGLKVVYYISPQIWAWKENRVYTIKKYCDEIICILPFEKEFYAKYNAKVHFVGHPLVQVIQEFKQQNPALASEPKTIALLPGSRLQEIQKKLPIFLSVVEHFPNFQFVIAQSPTLSAADYAPYLKDQHVQLVQLQTYHILNNAFAALVTSGTATLETALFGVPQIVCYKGSPLSYAIGKQLIKVPFISLVNLIAGKLVVKELIQNELNTQNLMTELNKLIDAEERNKIIEDYKQIHDVLGQNKASFLAAQIIVGTCR
jgi:lipid-A-disaccharide synthase